MNAGVQICSLCKTAINPGAVVCVGCQGSVVYGATQDEMATAFKIGAVIGGIAALMAWLYFATYSLSALLAMAGGAVVFGGLLSYWTAKAKRGLVRTFRYVHH